MVRISAIGVILAIAAALAAASLTSHDAAARSQSGSLSLVAYSTPRDAYTQLIPAFQHTGAGQGTSFQQSYGASGEQARAVIDGLKADVVEFSLEPDMTSLVKAGLVAKTWKQDVVKAGLVPGEGNFDHTTIPTPRPRQAGPLPDPLTNDAIVGLAAHNATDRSAANGSSIAFVVEYAGKRVLFAADAHPSVLTNALKRYAHRVGEARPHLDVVKLSHHGSNANVSARMLKLIDCRRWLISTNGDNFAHPDDATIAKVITWSDHPVTFFCNYRTMRTAAWGEHGPGVGATFKFPKANQHSIRVTV